MCPENMKQLAFIVSQLNNGLNKKFKIKVSFKVTGEYAQKLSIISDMLKLPHSANIISDQ